MTNPTPEQIARELALKHLPEMWRYPKGKPVDYNRVYREHAIAAILDAMRLQSDADAKVFMKAVIDYLGMSTEQREYGWHDVMDALEKGAAAIREQKP